MVVMMVMVLAVETLDANEENEENEENKQRLESCATIVDGHSQVSFGCHSCSTTLVG